MKHAASLNPNFVRWASIAPNIMQKDSIPPYAIELGAIRSRHVAASRKPIMYRPAGSIPSRVNVSMLSDAPVSFR